MRRRAVIEVEYTKENGAPITESTWFTMLLHGKQAHSYTNLRSVTVREDEGA